MIPSSWFMKTRNHETETRNQKCDRTLEITDFGFVKVGLPDEALAEQRAPMAAGQRAS
jgi:hypothetical protein